MAAYRQNWSLWYQGFFGVSFFIGGFVQFALQASPFNVLPSSHSSPGSIFPLPHGLAIGLATKSETAVMCPPEGRV
jgi:hypothetical protein